MKEGESWDENELKRKGERRKNDTRRNKENWLKDEARM